MILENPNNYSRWCEEQRRTQTNIVCASCSKKERRWKFRRWLTCNLMWPWFSLCHQVAALFCLLLIFRKLKDWLRAYLRFGKMASLKVFLILAITIGACALAAGLPLTYRCGFTFCSVTGAYGQYCDEGRCHSCERYFHLCQDEICDNKTVPPVCVVKMLLLQKVESTEPPEKHKDNNTWSPREIRLIVTVGVLSLAVAGLTVLVIYPKCCRKKSRRTQVPSDTHRSSTDTGTSGTDPSADSSSQEKEPLCYGEEKLKGVDESSHTKPSECVTSKNEYGRAAIPETETDVTAV